MQVTADIAGTDVEGITDVGLFISGTAKNGVWRATFVVPGGTPDGTYWIQAGLQDSAHFTSWVSSDSGWTIDNQVLDATLAPTGTHFVVANSS